MLNHKTIKNKQSQTYIALRVQCNVDMQTNLMRRINIYIVDNTTVMEIMGKSCYEDQHSWNKTR